MASTEQFTHKIAGVDIDALAELATVGHRAAVGGSVVHDLEALVTIV